MSNGRKQAPVKPRAIQQVMDFDVQAHRGARGLRPENTLAAFEYAVELGVTTLELDTGISADGVVVVCHDPFINPEICLPLGEPRSRRKAQRQRLPDIPRLWLKDLTLSEIQAFDCGSLNPSPKRFPNQKAVPGSYIPTLQQVFDLAESRNPNIRYNIESKVSPLHPEDTVTPKVFAEKLVAVIEQNHLTQRAMIQSFDWRVLQEVKHLNPLIQTSALLLHNDVSSTLMFPNLASPFLAGFNFRHFRGDLVALLQETGFVDVLSPNFEMLLPESNSFFQTISDFHEAGFLVVPWTVNEIEMMQRFIDLEVDGLITDFPDRLLNLLKSG